jgi:hypothetical protein
MTPHTPPCRTVPNRADGTVGIGPSNRADRAGVFIPGTVTARRPVETWRPPQSHGTARSAPGSITVPQRPGQNDAHATESKSLRLAEAVRRGSLDARLPSHRRIDPSEGEDRRWSAHPLVLRASVDTRRVPGGERRD